MTISSAEAGPDASGELSVLAISSLLLQGLTTRGIIGAELEDQLPTDPELLYKAMAALVLLGESFKVGPYDQSSSGEVRMIRGPLLDMQKVEESIRFGHDIAGKHAVSTMNKFFRRNMKFLGFRQTQVENFTNPIFESLPLLKLTKIGQRQAQCLQLHVRGLPDEEIRQIVNLPSTNAVQVDRYEGMKFLSREGYTPDVLSRLLIEVLTPGQHKLWKARPKLDQPAVASVASIRTGRKVNRQSVVAKPRTETSRALDQSSEKNKTDVDAKAQEVELYPVHEGIKTIIYTMVANKHLQPDYVDVLEAHLSGSRQVDKVDQLVLQRALLELKQFIATSQRLRLRFTGSNLPLSMKPLTATERDILALLVGDNAQGLAPRSVTFILAMKKIQQAGFTRDSLLDGIQQALSKLVQQADLREQALAGNFGLSTQQKYLAHTNELTANSQRE